MAFIVAELTREQKGYPRATHVSMPPNAPCAQGLPVERDKVAADIARVERRGYRARDAGDNETGGVSQPIDGAAHSQRPPIEDVQVDHPGGDVAMPEQFLHRPDVVAVFQ